MLDALYSHVARRAAIYLWLLVAFAAFGRWFAVTINVSDSLPGKVFLVQKGAKPDKGELAAFRYAGGGPYERGTLFLKEMSGVPGSSVVGKEIGGGCGKEAKRVVESMPKWLPGEASGHPVKVRFTLPVRFRLE